MKTWLLASAAALVLLVVVANRRRDLLALAGSSSEPVQLDASADSEPEFEQGQGWSFDFDVSPYLAAVDPATYLPTMTDASIEAANLAAFLMTIRTAEGTARPDGYRVMFGGQVFDGYADHPRRAVRFVDKRGRELWTSAAGAYQFMAVSPIPFTSKTTKVDTWDRLQRKLGLPDFSPASQDLAAVELIREAGALNDVQAGRFDTAIGKVRAIWASLPGAGYAQPEKTLASLRTTYAAAGGTFA